MIGEFLEENHQFIWRIIFTVIIAIIGVKFLASRNARLKQSQPAKKPAREKAEDDPLRRHDREATGRVPGEQKASEGCPLKTDDRVCRKG